MPFPTNRVVLESLIDIDFLACLALTDTCATLYDIILEQVVTLPKLCRFLRENQYALHHDHYHQHFSDKEVALLHRAFEVVQTKHGETLYDKTNGILGPLISRTPFELFKNSPALPDDFTMKTAPDRKGRQFAAGLWMIEWGYEIPLLRSWMHNPSRASQGDQRECGFRDFIKENPILFLRGDFLFSRRYVDDFYKCFDLTDYPIDKRFDRTQQSYLDSVTTLRNTVERNGVYSLTAKRTIQALLERDLRWRGYPREIITSATFRDLFRLPGWIEIWSPPELGWWFSLGLTQYGPEGLEGLIDQSFSSKRDALVWLFLGAHQWFHEHTRRPIPSHMTCCNRLPQDTEREYIADLIASVSREDRIWIVEQIVCLATEFGVCSDLGAAIYSYFILRDPAESEQLDLILTRAISTSRLRPLFEYTIGLAKEEVDITRSQEETQSEDTP
jgi:hypothetical protein